MAKRDAPAPRAWRGVIEEYRAYLPVTPGTPLVTLLEGATPLLRASRLGRHLPGIEVYLKCEGQNPTGSFKDRGMTLAMSKAVEEGSRAVLCASTGNTAAAAAAYASRAGLPCFVVVPAGGVAVGKLVQAMAQGARVVPVEGSFDEALRIVREAAPKFRLTLVNSVNPYRIEGQKTGAFESCDALAARRRLAVEEGVSSEPSSAAPVAGLLKRAREGRLPGGILAACVLTGHGLKDPESVLRTERRPEAVPATAEALERVVDEVLAVR